MAMCLLMCTNRVVEVQPMPAKAADTRGTLRGLLFDMDGTLLDSEKVWDVALADLAQWLGGDLSVAARQRMVGSSLARSIAIVHDDLNVDADPESSGDFLITRTEQLFHTELVWKPGARELLVEVRDAGIPAALVTSTHRRLTEIALDVIGRDFFAATVCGDEVGKPKPHPEPYLHAAELLGVPASRCVAIEDSWLGLTAAQAAGCVVLVVPSEVPVDDDPSRTVLPTLAGVNLAFLERLVDDRATAR
jgi:HAD superfamily hydrolase (TIGR01509 family)